jgi:ArsR family transcriptional regulator
VLQRARALARRRRVKNVVWKVGEIEAVSLQDEAVDIVLLSQALHHTARPEKAMAEAERILKVGGRVLVLDLREHDQTWVQARLGDRHLGFSDKRLEAIVANAGFREVKVSVGARLKGDPFTVLIASGIKPAAPGR